jgi:hypothetical protein
MLEAVKNTVQGNPQIVELRLSLFDAYDLFKLKPSDLVEFGIESKRAESICGDLLRGSLSELSDWLGVQLVKDKRQRNLIPGEGFRRTAGIWATGNDDPDAIVEEIRRLRNPEPR